MKIDLMQRIRKLNPTQQAVLDDRKRAICAQGGFGSGKSLLLNIDGLVTACDNPGGNILIIRKTFEQIVDSVIPDMRNNFEGDEAKFPKEMLYGGKWSTAFSLNDRKPELKLNTYPAARFQFRGATFDGREDPSRFGSMPFVGVLIEEFSDFDNPQTFNYLDGRCRQKTVPNGYNRLLLVGNPPMESHWSQYEFRQLPKLKESVAKRRGFYILPTEENAENLPEDYIQNMKDTYSEAWLRRYFRGECGIIEEGQPVLAGFFVAQTKFETPWHIAGDKLEPNRMFPIIRAWDFGVAYMSCVWMQFVPTPIPHIIILHELTGRNTSALQFGKTIGPLSNNMFPNMSFIDIADPSGRNRSLSDGRSPIKVLRDKYKINCIPAPTNDIQERIDGMIEVFSKNAMPGHPYVQISNSPGTATLRDALELGWAYKRESGGFISPNAVPMKNQYSHPADACGYGLDYIEAYGDSINSDHAHSSGTQIITPHQPAGWMSM